MIIHDNINHSLTTLTNFTVSGVIGTAAATVDIITAYNIPQTTANVVLTLPNPTDAKAGTVVYINNTGTATFTMYGQVIATNRHLILIWTGTAWSISNSNAVKQERIGRIQTGDVGGGTTATATGAFASVTKASLAGRSEYTVTFITPMPSTAYTVFITPVSLGVLTDDNEIRVPVLRGANLTINSFFFYVEEISGVLQNLEYHILVKEF